MMKGTFIRLTVTSAVTMVLVVTTAATAAPVTTAFSYQGYLKLNGMVVNDTCDFEFTLWDDPAVGSQVGPTLTFDGQGGNPAPIAVANGVFSVELDFGDGVFSGQALWLEIAVACPSGNPLQALAPRQELTPSPYALGLRLPYAGQSDDIGNAFDITNVGLGRAGNFSISNVANTSAALNAVTLGSGPAGAFLNDSGANAVSARAVGGGVAVYAEAEGYGLNGKAIHGMITAAGAGEYSAAVYGENTSTTQHTIGVFGVHTGNGWGVAGRSQTGRGVFGESLLNFGYGVYGVGNGMEGTGVYGRHTSTSGEYPGVWGITDSLSQNAAGVRGEAQSTTSGLTFGVHGRSLSERGVGVRGEGDMGVEGLGLTIGVRGEASDVVGEGVHGEGSTGVYGLGDASGVTGQGGDSSSYGVWAIGYGGRLSEPALRADNQDGPAIYALGGRGVEGEGTEFGVRGVTWENSGVGGTFVNYGNGVALRSVGRAEVQGTLSTNVLEILGGADLAERFEFSEHAEPGMVAAIDPDHPGQLRVSREAHNRRVVGVVSGANELGAGVVLGTKPGAARSLPVALSGRVWVRCDARQQAVTPGDFLTTSDIRGLAMPVVNRERAHGAIIGKAMTALARGEPGLVLVLVNLQ